MGPYYNYRYGLDVVPAASGVVAKATSSDIGKDAFKYAGASVVGALLARHFVRGTVGLLLGASGGLMVAALAIAHPKGPTL